MLHVVDFARIAEQVARLAPEVPERG